MLRVAPILALSAALLGLACDTPPPPAGGEAKAGESAAAGDAAAASVGAGAGAAAAKGPSYDECLAACNDPKNSPDDKATCRLNCGQSDAIDRRAVGAAPAGDPPQKPIVDAFRTCTSGCVGDACSRCADETSAAEATVNALKVGKSGGDPAAMKACAKTCLEALGTCDQGCAGKGADDAATCGLNCGGEASVCLGKC